jgi:hypothetical protein
MLNISVLFEMLQTHHKLYTSFKALLLRIFLSRRVRRLTKAMIWILLDSARTGFFNT